ncbi:hypothetical protein GCM10017752_29990 [Streptomyces roseoviridis]
MRFAARVRQWTDEVAALPEKAAGERGRAEYDLGGPPGCGGTRGRAERGGRQYDLGSPRVWVDT